jgi:hypothetical protein
MKDHNEREDDDDCPICLTSYSFNREETSLVFCCAPCSHIFCQPCADRLFLAGSSARPHDDSQEDIYFNIPTLGHCPLCRQGVSLFDFQILNTNDMLYPKNHNVSSWPIHQSTFQQQTSSEGSSFISMAFKFSERPSVEFLNPLLQHDGTLLESAEFDDSSHFLEKSMTFHGSMVFGSPVGPQKYGGMDCLLQFSRDFRYIRDGYIRWTFAPQDDPSEFPLDGTWRVTWENGHIATLKVRRHNFSVFGGNYRMEIGGEEDHYRPQFRWPMFYNGTAVLQTSTISIPPGTSGPGIEERIEWTTTYPGHSGISWTRLSFLDDEKDGRNLIFLGHRRGEVPVYRRLQSNLQEDRIPPTYHGNSLWGNTFCQGFCVGLASYHFLATAGSNEGGDEALNHKAYISYENPLTAMWPNLDDGSPIPARVPFRDIEWDESNRVFRGNICWLEDYGTTWQGQRKWSYEMKFDSSFIFILSGTVFSFLKNSEAPHDSHIFGQDLVYINASTKDYLAGVLDDSSKPREWHDVCSQWQAEQASERNLQMLLAIFRGRAIDMNA